MSWFKKRECKHEATGYRGAKPYIFQKYSQVDGIGRIHLHLYARCDKCGKDFPYAMMHLDRALTELCQYSTIRSEIQRVVDNTPIKR
mgnify:FL=1